MWLFLAVPWVGLQCVIVVFPDHTHLPFYYRNGKKQFLSIKISGEILDILISKDFLDSISTLVLHRALSSRASEASKRVKHRNYK